MRSTLLHALPLLVAFALVAGTAPAQPPAAETAAPPRAPAATPAKQPAELVEALALIEAGDLEGAIAVLEDLRAAGDATGPALAALGALYVEIGLPRDAADILRPLAERPDADPAVLYNAGRAALELGEAETGERYLRRSVAAEPLSPAARLLGLRLGARGGMADAYRLLVPWVRAHPDDVEARLAAVVGALALERLTEAEALLEGLAGDDPRLRLLRADLALKRREPDAARALLEPLAAEPPAEMAVDVLGLLATAYVELGRSADAVTLLSRPGREHPKLALTLARAHRQAGDDAAALAVLEPWAAPLLEAGTAPPSGGGGGLAASVLLELGRLLTAAERYGDAAAALARATELDPWNRETWQALARAHALAGNDGEAKRAAARFEEIVAARDRARETGPRGAEQLDDPVGKRLVEAREKLEQGRGEEALAIVRQEISLAPDDPRPRLLEVRTLLRLDRPDDALAAVEATLERFPDHPDALHHRAVIRLRNDDADGAETDLRRALELAPQHLPAMNDLALVHARRGERDAARALLEQILALRPDDALARQRLAALDATDNP